PHSRFRNRSSRLAKRVFRLLVGSEATETFTSFRLLDGVVARSLAAYYGADVYLDVALTWVVGKVAYQEVTYRPELRPPSAGSGYNVRSLLSHFRRLVVTSGVRPLRFVAAIGMAGMLLGGITAVVVLAFRLFGDIPTQGWASVMIFVSLTSGLILFALGIVAEYLSSTLNMASGRPPYLTLHRPPRSSATSHDDT
ncbi:MAG: glycosyltransferase, partial [Acidimicrobiia bacterium]|nr:glycosyltransferase [Acidimicrobiia bacterium]